MTGAKIKNWQQRRDCRTAFRRMVAEREKRERAEIIAADIAILTKLKSGDCQKTA